MDKKTLTTQKNEARSGYKAARAAYIAEPTPEKWRAFCDAKRVCMALGIIL